MDMTIKQAHDNINSVFDRLRDPVLLRGEHVVLADSLALLYTGAKDNEESRQAVKEPEDG